MTIEQVLNLAETLNSVTQNASLTTHDITVNGVNKEDLEQLAKQERGRFFPFEGYYCCSVRLGTINFIITSKN